MLATICVIMSGALASTSQAYVVEYWHALTNSGEGFTAGLVKGGLTSNTVYYLGSGSVNVCEHVYDNVLGWISSKCANNWVEGTPAELEPHKNDWNTPYGGNNSGFAHTLYGVYGHA